MRSLFPLLAVLMVGCAFDAPPATPPNPSRGMFDDQIYPLLLRDCGFPDCHGSHDRFFRIFGPGRTRLDAATELGEVATTPEMDEAYDRARSMLASAGRAEDALLVRKPLEVDRGGAPHLGIDEFGQDVYSGPDAPGYELLLEWARTGLPE